MRVFGPGPTRIGVSSAQITCARMIRHRMKTQQKISGRLRSEQATRHRYAIRGYIDTARKHGVSVLTAVRDALAGNPWMPPIPDPP